MTIGVEQEIVLEALNLDALDKKMEHFCKVNVSGKEHVSAAKIATDSIRCEKIQLAPDNAVDSTSFSVPLSLATKYSIIDIANGNSAHLVSPRNLSLQYLSTPAPTWPRTAPAVWPSPRLSPADGAIESVPTTATNPKRLQCATRHELIG